MSSAVSSAYVILKPILQTLLTLITQTDCFLRSHLIRIYSVFFSEVYTFEYSKSFEYHQHIKCCCEIRKLIFDYALFSKGLIFV